MAFKTQKFELVELVVPGVAGGQTNTRWAFPDLPKLRYVSLQGISFYTPGTITTTPLGNPLFAISVLKTGFLTLYANERQDIYRTPVLELNRIQNSATDPFARGLFEFTGQKVTWDKSFVEFGAAPANTSNTSLLFGVFYA
jgi:hypothetical protein